MHSNLFISSSYLRTKYKQIYNVKKLMSVRKYISICIEYVYIYLMSIYKT